MRVVFFNTREYEKPHLYKANNGIHDLVFHAERLSLHTVHLAKGFDAVSVFTSDDVSGEVILQLARLSVKYIAVRATGHDNIDIRSAIGLGLQVANVPAYSPESIAEHAVALMLALGRGIIIADKQVHKHNFTIDNLVGFTLHGKTVGIIGTGKTGIAAARILHGFGCRLLGYDIQPDKGAAVKYDMEYTGLEELCESCQIITIHAPLNQATKYLINASLLMRMKKGVMLINTARGAIVNTADIIACLKNGHVGYYGMDVYEHEQGLFFCDRSAGPLDDAMMERLLSFPNVIVTPHQAFATSEALEAIAAATMLSFNMWKSNGKSPNELIN